MGNINMCKGNDHRSGLKTQPSKSKIQSYTNKLIQEVEVDSDNITIQLYSGFCSIDQSDVTVNISDEFISRSSNAQEMMLFSRAGEELKKETTDYINKHKLLHHKLPFYTHAGDLPVSNVIHCTLSENKRIINDNQIQQTFIECLQIADQELEASSISFPMIHLRNYSLSRISRIMVRSIKHYFKRAKRGRSQHLQIIKIIGDEPKLQAAYMNTIQETYQEIVKTFCQPRKNSEKSDFGFERPYSCDQVESYIPSFKSDTHFTLHYRQSKDFEFDE